MNKLRNFLSNHLAFVIVTCIAILCSLFVILGKPTESGYITLDGKDAKIEEYTEKFIENSNDALYRIMNEDAPTDEETINDNAEPVGLGGSVTLDQVIARRMPDGNNDNGRGWQCSKYTAYLATGKREYSTVHPDYGPVNGKDVASYLVKNYGWKYIDTPIYGAIGSGGFNTKYGHTAMYLNSTGTNTAMVNDANYIPLTVSTHNMNISGWVWVVPGDYQLDPEPTPAPTPQPTPTPSETSYTVKRGDTLGEIALKLGWCKGCKLFGDDGYTQKLADYNNISNRGLIYPGQIIRRK